MKKTLLSVATTMIILSQSQIHADDCCDNNTKLIFDNYCSQEICCENGFYAGILGGANFLENTPSHGFKANFDTGYSLTGLIGYRFCNGVRLEGEYTYRKNALNDAHIRYYGNIDGLDGHFQSSAFIANVLWDLPLSSWGCDIGQIRPYLGAGLGYDYEQVKILDEHNNGGNYAWQVMGGVSFPVVCNTDIVLEYKFHKSNAKHLYNNTVSVGVKYYFGS